MSRTALVQSIGVLLSIVSLVLAGCGSDAQAAKAKRPPPKVTVAHPVTRKLTEEADYNGWLEALKHYDVRARVRGHIKSVDFKDGQRVTKGQVLFQLDKAPFEVDLANALAQVKALEAQEASAKALAERNRELVKSHAVSQQELEQSEANAKSFSAQIEATKAAAERIQLDIDYCSIKAEIDGRVGKAELTEGALVNAAGTESMLTTIVSDDVVYVDFYVDERTAQYYQLKNVNKDKTPLRDRNITFHFGLESDKGYPREGKLVFADVQYTEGTGTILVRGEAKNENGLLVPGSRVRVRVPLSDEFAATLVPDTAVNTDQKEKYLLVVGKDNQAERLRLVDTGRLLDDGMRVVLSPKIPADTWIITEGMERARIHEPVDPVQETAETSAEIK